VSDAEGTSESAVLSSGRETSASLQAEILARLSEAPQQRCLAFYLPQEPVRWLSREEVHRRAARAARRLLRDGVKAGDVCVIVLPSGEAAALAVVATLLIGAVPLLIAPPTLVAGNRELSDTLASTLRLTRARLALCASSLEPMVAPLVTKLQHTRFTFVSATSLADADEPLTPVLPAATDVAAMQLTSGTTAKPRICVWDHRAILAALDGMAAAMRMRADDVCLSWTPLYHDMGLVNNFLLCLARGVPLIMLSPQDFIRSPALWLRGLSESAATVTWSPNFGFAVTARKVAGGELEGVRLDRVRAFWNAAERIHLETLETFYRRFAALGVRWEALKTNYGCAENVGGATFGALDAPLRHEHVDRNLLDQRGMAQRLPSARDDARSLSVVSVGRPRPGLAIRVLSAHGKALPDGCVGEICLETPSRMLRYHKSARDTAHALRGGLLHTGDLGYLRDGELYFVGRVRERITVEGKKIDPSAFEKILTTTPGVREGCFAAFGISDQSLGTERVIVVSEVRAELAGSVTTLLATIRRRCFLQLGIVPDDVMLVRPGTLAKTSSGKRRHRYFRKRYLAGELEPARIRVDESRTPSAAASSILQP
jgi:acyl-CoA synthetase (AMP-forming)/AMP-acid ligase II